MLMVYESESESATEFLFYAKNDDGADLAAAVVVVIVGGSVGNNAL